MLITQKFHCERPIDSAVLETNLNYNLLLKVLLLKLKTCSLVKSDVLIGYTEHILGACEPPALGHVSKQLGQLKH